MACAHHGWQADDLKLHLSAAATTFQHGSPFILKLILYIITVFGK